MHSWFGSAHRFCYLFLISLDSSEPSHLYYWSLALSLSTDTFLPFFYGQLTSYSMITHSIDSWKLLPCHRLRLASSINYSMRGNWAVQRSKLGWYRWMLGWDGRDYINTALCWGVEPKSADLPLGFSWLSPTPLCTSLRKSTKQTGSSDQNNSSW